MCNFCLLNTSRMSAYYTRVAMHASEHHGIAVRRRSASEGVLTDVHCTRLAIVKSNLRLIVDIVQSTERHQRCITSRATKGKERFELQGSEDSRIGNDDREGDARRSRANGMVGHGSSGARRENRACEELGAYAQSPY